jgi:hypothetical protein
MNPLKSLMQLLKDASVAKIEISAEPPFAKLVFDKSELAELLQRRSMVADVVARHFVRRRVFWEDIAKEQYLAVVKSLEEAEAGLDSSSAELGASGDRAVLGMAKFVRAWATACSLTRKALSDRLRDIDDEKASTPGYDWAGEHRDEALREALISVRQRIYPLVILLVSFLEENDPTRVEAQGHLDRGLNVVPDARLQRGVLPQVDEAQPGAAQQTAGLPQP